MFRKMVKNCEYCRFGTMQEDGVAVCAKNGKVHTKNKCWSFDYDPLKRIPRKKKALDFSKYDQEDFSL